MHSNRHTWEIRALVSARRYQRKWRMKSRDLECESAEDVDVVDEAISNAADRRRGEHLGSAR